ncbi:MAG: mannose-1-phosphate guanylyltransferase [Candidatus Microgenomates bacterium]
MHNANHLYVVILCGGGGTRLWPLSRSKSPKQFIELVGTETLFEKTLKRAQDIVPNDHIYIMTNKDYTKDVTTYAKVIPKRNIIAEPQKKNTALAMGVIAGVIHVRDPKAVIINLASDHLISDLPEFKKAMLAAAKVASQGQHFVTVGITPTFPHTGLGYIHADGQIGEEQGLAVIKVAGFREKPDKKTAKEFLTTNQYYWNANLYTWSSKLILDEFKIHAPEISTHITKIMQAVDQPDFDQVLAHEYSLAPEAQIDTAISEKTSKLAVIPGVFGWTDIGSWNVVYDEVEKDEHGNALILRENGADWLAIDTKNSLVSTHKKQIVTLGIDNLLVVDTPDALLIVHKDRAQDVKKVVEQLKATKREELL